MDVIWFGMLNDVDTSLRSLTGGPQKFIKGPFLKLYNPKKLYLFEYFPKKQHQNQLEFRNICENCHTENAHQNFAETSSSGRTFDLKNA